MILTMTFALGENKGQPQWKSFSADGNTLYIPHKLGAQPTAAAATWKVEEAFTGYKDPNSPFRVVIVNLLEAIATPKQTVVPEVKPVASKPVATPQSIVRGLTPGTIPEAKVKLPSDRALRRKGIDPARLKAEIAMQTAAEATGVQPRNGVVQFSARSLRRAAQQAQA